MIAISWLTQPPICMATATIHSIPFPAVFGDNHLRMPLFYYYYILSKVYNYDLIDGHLLNTPDRYASLMMNKSHTEDARLQARY